MLTVKILGGLLLIVVLAFVWVWLRLLETRQRANEYRTRMEAAEEKLNREAVQS